LGRGIRRRPGIGLGQGFGRGTARGFGGGAGRGSGRGFGWNLGEGEGRSFARPIGFGYPRPSFSRSESFPVAEELFQDTPAKEEETSYLTRLVDSLEQELRAVKGRLKRLTGKDNVE
jgi:hypothetical protein